MFEETPLLAPFCDFFGTGNITSLATPFQLLHPQLSSHSHSALTAEAPPPPPLGWYGEQDPEMAQGLPQSPIL